jgi:hypothetical protein
VSPLDKKKQRSQVEKDKKLQEITEKSYRLVTGSESCIADSADSRIIAELVPIFHSKDSIREKMSLLTIAAAAKLSVAEIVKIFGTTEHFAKKALELHSSKGMLAQPEPKKAANVLAPEVIESVKQFYLRDSNSKQLPGKSDNITVKVAGEKVLMQKRLLLQPLKFLYDMFKEENPEMIIGFIKFTQLRPKECVFPTSARTFSQCMCLIHTNPNLILESIDIKSMTALWVKPINSCSDCISLMQCATPTEECHLRTYVLTARVWRRSKMCFVMF